ncbi:AMP-binding protein [Cupriavidus basilensis]
MTFEELRDQSARLPTSSLVRAFGRVIASPVCYHAFPNCSSWSSGPGGRGRSISRYLLYRFGPKAVEHRIASSEAKLIVTDQANRPKLDEVTGCPSIMTITGEESPQANGTDSDFHAELSRQSDSFEPVLRKGDNPCMMLFTSGTTGLAKGVPVPYKALLSFQMYMRYAVDLRPGDKFWNIADPGWAYGLYYGVIGPLLLGHATTFYDGPFSVESTYHMIAKYGITQPRRSAHRLPHACIAAGPEQAKARAWPPTRVVSSAGEPLNPEVIRWFRDNLDCRINDHYGQTETGMVLCNFHGLAHPVRPWARRVCRSRGYHLTVVDHNGNELPAGQPGTLAVDREKSPLYYFQGYWHHNSAAFVGKYYVTGDTVERGEDGSFAFVGRGDDIITSAGYRIGPFDVESSLIEHPAVAETAVIGKPDPERTEIVKAFVVLKQGYGPTESLVEELQLMVKRRLAAHAYPREIQFVGDLPKTPSGEDSTLLAPDSKKLRARITSQAPFPLLGARGSQ